MLAPVDLVTELIGIPATGDESIRYEIRQGDEVNILVQCDDVPAQQALAALEGGGSTGIVEHYVRDNRLEPVDGHGHGQRRPQAVLAATRHRPLRDPRSEDAQREDRHDQPAGTVAWRRLHDPDREIDQIDRAPGLYPRYTVTASSVRFSLEDVIRRLQLEP